MNFWVVGVFWFRRGQAQPSAALVSAAWAQGMWPGVTLVYKRQTKLVKQL